MADRQCLDLDKDDAIVVRPLFESIENNFTIEFWVNSKGNIILPPEACHGVYGGQGQQYILAPGYGELPAFAGAGISIGTNGIAVFEHTENYLPALLVYETLLLGWVHIAVVYKNRQPLLYINGRFKKSGLVSSRSRVFPSGTFGLLKPYGSFIGKVADIRIWNHAREEEQIRLLMDAKLTGSEDGLAGYWNLANLEGNIIYDSSINQFHGVIEGESWHVSCESDQDFVLAVSHSNYLGSIGGTERYIFEHERYLRNHGVEMLHIFPQGSNIGINYDGKYIGSFKPDTVLKLLERGIKVKEAFVHHLLLWPPHLYWLLINQLNDQNIKITFFVHDFFFCCPSIHLIYKNNRVMRPCVLPLERHCRKDICAECDWSVSLHSWRKSFFYLLNKGHRIVTPSEFVYDIFTDIYPDLAVKTIKQPHLRMLKAETKGLNLSKNRKIRLAYLGVITKLKGQQVWEKVITNENLQQSYDFYHIGSGSVYQNVQSYPFNFWDNGVMAATNTLLQNEIDLVLLWSVVPESYSYTFHEAQAAGVAVLTSQFSGNIADQIRKNSHLGRVLNNEDELVNFLSDTDQVRELLNLSRDTYQLEFNPLPFDNTKV